MEGGWKGGRGGTEGVMVEGGEEEGQRGSENGEVEGEGGE